MPVRSTYIFQDAVRIISLVKYHLKNFWKAALIFREGFEYLKSGEFNCKEKRD